jgi:serine kinase of HPr protein (carbohydrate metabolism regulator)
LLAIYITPECRYGDHQVPRLDEVFKKSGVPTHTFVPPAEYDRVAVALKTPGRGIIVEGPSGIGKTSCVRRTIDDVGLEASCLFLSARKKSDVELISELPSIKKIGVVVVDDFHRLPSVEKNKLTDFIKVLADEEEQESKVILG